MLPETQRKGSCKPCRESKAKCDKKRPRCSECVARNKQCGGYDMGNIFININSAGPPPVWNRSQNAQKYLVLDLASQPAIPTEPPTSLPTSLPYCSIDASSSSMTALAPPPTLPTFTDPDPNNIPGIVDLFLDLYYRRFGPEKSSADLLTVGNECGGWRSLLPYWIGQSHILDTAIGAMAASFIGTQYQDDSLIDQGRNMYLNALQMVQKALSEPNSSERRDLLATTLVMSSTELFMSNGAGASQLAHVEGATRLLHNAFKSYNFEELHIYILNQGLFESISSRRRYPFSSPAYRNLIRQMYSCPRTNQNDLYFQWCEIILPLPNILSAADSVTPSASTSRASTPTPASAVLSILDDLTTLEQSLAPWYETLKTQTPGPWTFPAPQTSADSVPFPLQFISIEVCTLYCLYWTSQLLILDARLCLNSYLPVSEIPEHPTGDLPAQIAEYASLICRSIQFCTQNTSFASTENMFFPLFVVTNHYKRKGDEERTKWCVGAFARIAQEQKIGYAIEKLGLVQFQGNQDVGDMEGVWDEA